ncbi:hypothetical protein A2982_01190 [candidate division WWE3 bacterium RIFCSPLOWO2_01_FULL_39_13]|uniref:Transcriptional regulator MraZ n=1 Tax=candidate division WWE3 bacterium RIFCSPLOWO2_01_FULL_39_13 TaxID=1802624 RepID=A0A1F4V2B3_UNCKA|nr:MAG: hypothetical protein A2982_01190 [candidate division WWE3 bacterium RIFCSPLOWO2_01_FULL_39_13]
MIIGEYSQKISEKNRTAFPGKFREELGSKLVITKGYEGCLVIMSPAQWEEMVSDNVSGPFVSELIRDTRRFLLGGASEIDLDPQGRFVIPAYLKTYSGLIEEAVYVGLGTWVELWSRENWDEKRKDVESRSSVIGEKLSKTNG